MTGFHQHPDPEVGKAQWLRLADIWLLGPAMIYAGVTGRIPESWRTFSIAGGIFTIVWNWQNYARVAALDSAARELREAIDEASSLAVGTIFRHRQQPHVFEVVGPPVLSVKALERGDGEVYDVPVLTLLDPMLFEREASGAGGTPALPGSPPSPTSM